jgi:DNA mismatch endonuclease, patch repair protein
MTRSNKDTYRIMSSIRSKNTCPEIKLGKAMFKIGLRYRKHPKNVFGHPDFIFTRAKLAIFVDGDFWHGNNWKIRGMKSIEDELSSYGEFWRSKIIRNMKRDALVNERLTAEGWIVMRFFESEIKIDVDYCANKIKDKYKLINI